MSNEPKLIRVCVLPQRSLSLPSGDGPGATDHYVAGDELELPADEAKQLARGGFVEKL